MLTEPTKCEDFQNMMPHFIHIVKRISTPRWSINEGSYFSDNLILIYDGIMLFEINGEKYEAGKGDLVYFPGGSLRSAVTKANELLHCFSVDFTYCIPVVKGEHWEISQKELPFNTVERISDVNLFSRLMTLFNDLTRSWISENYNRMNSLRSIFVEIITLLVMRKSGMNINYDKIRKVDKIITYIMDNYTQQIQLEELANLNQISVSYTSKIFKEITGQTPVEYITHMRIKKAKQLLSNGHSVEATADQVGFSDPSYFSRCFKKNEGLSPARYRSFLTSTMI